MTEEEATQSLGYLLRDILLCAGGTELLSYSSGYLLDDPTDMGVELPENLMWVYEFYAGDTMRGIAHTLSGEGGSLYDAVSNMVLMDTTTGEEPDDGTEQLLMRIKVVTAPNYWPDDGSGGWSGLLKWVFRDAIPDDDPSVAYLCGRIIGKWALRTWGGRGAVLDMLFKVFENHTLKPFLPTLVNRYLLT